MQEQDPKISVICYFHNLPERIDATLQTLSAVKEVDCELIIINDGSQDETSSLILQHLERYRPKNTLFFDHESPLGRGMSLSKALEHINNRFVWIPESLEDINENHLAEAAKALFSTDAAFAVGTYDDPPSRPSAWIQLLLQEKLPSDQVFLFDKEKIPDDALYFDPHWFSNHASELAIRLQKSYDFLSVTPFVPEGDDLLFVEDAILRECAMALLRESHLSLSEKKSALRMLVDPVHAKKHSAPTADVHEQENQDDIAYEQEMEPDESENNRLTTETPEADPEVSPESPPSDTENIENPDFEETSGSNTPPNEERSESSPQHPEESLKERPDADDSEPIESETGEQAKTPVESGEEPSDTDQPADSKDSGLPEESLQQEHETDSLPAEENSSTDEGHPATEEEPYSGSGFFAAEIRNQQPVTIIIPTSTNRRPLLDDCLNAIFRFTARDRTNVIVVDNGTVDDTKEYLHHLIQENLPLTILSNEKNAGFAGAVNQGLAKAGDGVILVMHNDVILKSPLPARMADILENHPDIGVVSPKTNYSWNDTQVTDSFLEAPPEDKESAKLTDVDYLDGYCLAFRNQPGLTFSKQYGLAYFEDTDFCYRMRKDGKRVVVAHNEFVTHLGGKTTSDLGLTMRSKAYWKNASIFQNEWRIEPAVEKDWLKLDPIEQFVHIGSIINPFYPEPALLDFFKEQYTSEQKTRVLNSEFSETQLFPLIRLMMAANEREVLRKLEEQLVDLKPDGTLYHDLIAFYFERTIFSRCKLYINRLEPAGLPIDIALFQLKVAIGEKDYQRAAVLLQDMMVKIPTHPDVLLSASEIHRRNGNQEQSEKFLVLAEQFNPHLRRLS